MKRSWKMHLAVLSMGMALVGSSLEASAAVYSTRATTYERHSAKAGQTSGSFLAAAQVGLQGTGRSIPTEDALKSGCIGRNTTYSNRVNWPDSCPPEAMKDYLTYLIQGSGYVWNHYKYTSSQKATASGAIIESLKNWGSPILTPLYGLPDHWVSIVKVETAAYGTSGNDPNCTSGTSECLKKVWLYDTQNLTGEDSLGNGTLGGVLAFSGLTWYQTYWDIIRFNNGCASTTCDPNWDRFVLLRDPKSTARESANGPAPVGFVTTPGVIDPGERFDEGMAQERIFEAMVSAGLDTDEEFWSSIGSGRAGEPLYVEGVWPSGALHDYYLVPIFTAPGRLGALVSLSAENGAFEMVQWFQSPTYLRLIDAVEAQELAEEAAGSSLVSGGALGWTTEESAVLSSNPISPSYYFDVYTGGGGTSARLAVNAVTGESRWLN